MDGQEYLNQISAGARPVKQKKTGGLGGLVASPIFKVAAIGVGVFVVLAIIGGILGGSGGGVEEQATRLLLHIDNTATAVKTYQPSLKSSTLRSHSASFGSVLSNTSRDLAAYMEEKYNYKAQSADKTLVADATLHQDELDSELFNAKINGILDRIYAHKMAYEISLITASESKLYYATRDDALKEIINTSYGSLENLYTLFNDFSETK